MTKTTFEILTALDAVANGDMAAIVLSGEVYPRERVADVILSRTTDFSDNVSLASSGDLQFRSSRPSRELRVAALGEILNALIVQAVEARDAMRAARP